MVCVFRIINSDILITFLKPGQRGQRRPPLATIDPWMSEVKREPEQGITDIDVVHFHFGSLPAAVCRLAQLFKADRIIQFQRV